MFIKQDPTIFPKIKPDFLREAKAKESSGMLVPKAIKKPPTKEFVNPKILIKSIELSTKNFAEKTTKNVPIKTKTIFLTNSIFAF